MKYEFRVRTAHSTFTAPTSTCADAQCERGVWKYLNVRNNFTMLVATVNVVSIKGAFFCTYVPHVQQAGMLMLMLFI